MRQERIRVIQWATGAVGVEAVKIMADRPGIEVVGALVHHREKAGRDLGEVVGLGRLLGVTTSADPGELFSQARADLVLHATAANLQANVAEIRACVEAGFHVITVSGLSYPWRRHPLVAQELDGAARAQGVTILGTDINPGYLLDLLPVVLSGLCAQVRRIRMRRVSEMGHYDSIPVLQSVGIGISPEELRRRSQEGSLLLGELFLEVIDMVAAALGWELTETEVIQEPIVARKPRRAACMEILPGMTCGVRVVLRGKVREEAVVVLEEPMLVAIDPAEDGLEYGTTLKPTRKCWPGRARPGWRRILSFGSRVWNWTAAPSLIWSGEARAEICWARCSPSPAKCGKVEICVRSWRQPWPACLKTDGPAKRSLPLPLRLLPATQMDNGLESLP